MKMYRSTLIALALSIAATGCVLDAGDPPESTAIGESGGGGGGGGNPGDTITVTKCYTNATPTSGGQMLIKAASSKSNATLTAYRPDGSVIGNVQNGGGSKYGGTVMPYQSYDPRNVTIKSSAGGSITVPTTPFQI
jgi:hypothetical protein